MPQSGRWRYYSRVFDKHADQTEIMKDMRSKTIHRVLRWVAKLLLILCCALGQAQEHQILPDAPPIAKTSTTASTGEPNRSSMSTEPLKSTVADPLPPTLTEPECGEEQSVPSSPNSSCIPKYDPLQLFLNSSAPDPLTPKQKALLARKDVVDPFNLLTISGLSAISIAANANSPYGPGVKGWARLSGVSLTQDMTHEIVGTFLIPSLVHQDPRYHRMPNASYKRRIAHCIYQVIWTESDDGKGMFNYATVLGSALDGASVMPMCPTKELAGPQPARVMGLAWQPIPSATSSLNLCRTSRATSTFMWSSYSG
jgi:hypothetical protein